MARDQDTAFPTLKPEELAALTARGHQSRTRRVVILSEAKEPCPDAWLLRFAQDDDRPRFRMTTGQDSG